MVCRFAGGTSPLRIPVPTKLFHNGAEIDYLRVPALFDCYGKGLSREPQQQNFVDVVFELSVHGFVWIW